MNKKGCVLMLSFVRLFQIDELNLSLGVLEPCYMLEIMN